MKTVVAALNGFKGDRKGFDVTDLVNPRAKQHGFDYYLGWRGRPARGGAGPIAKHRFKKWVRKHAKKGHNFLFVGKSYGAHWILDIYDDVWISSGSKALLFDPACSLRRAENHQRVVDTPQNITVVRQLGLRSGYQVHGSRDFVIEARHSDIERTQQALTILDSWLTKNGL